MLCIAKKHLVIGICLITLTCLSAATAADWPQWRGPDRDGVCTETGLLKSWPDGGPKLLWEISGLGKGYSSMSIVDGKLYTMGDIEIDTATGGSKEAQCVIAYDLTTRERLWATEVGPTHDDGPRCTPTVDDGLIYAIGTSGDVVCLDADTGKLRWQKHLQRDLGGGDNPGWKFSESPLIDGDKLLCTPGGREAVMAALNKKTGGVIWKCAMPDIGRRGKDEAGYSSAVITDGAGTKQYVQLTNKGLIGVAAEDGTFLWGYNKIANRVANIATAVVRGDHVFCSTAYGTGAALLKLKAKDDGVEAEEMYFLDDGTFQNHHGGFVRVGDYIYGGHDHNKGKPTCVEMATGKIMWQQDQPGDGSAAVLYADGHLYFRYQNNVVVLIEANPNEYRLKSTFKLPKRDGMAGPGWAHPVISDGRLYMRHADVLFCYDIRSR
ncbi:MAG: PQQ-like beta-propeller repeat protein [Phycisphaerales bacterium]|nr:MAG: PQQ-like beta-propeller repeat protein [Phycisphaerales bacterium]